MAYYLPPKRTKQKIPCSVCNQCPCYRHCNNCGISIRWDKDEMGRSWIYQDGTDIVHYNPITRKGCMNEGTKSGQYLDVNNKRSNVGNFWQDNIVQERDNGLAKQEKIKRYLRLTGGSYVESLKEEKNLWLAEKWREYTFDYGSK